MFPWLTTTITRDTVESISRALSILIYLWLLKLYLIVWWYRSKRLNALREVPAWLWPLFGAMDFGFCAGLAVLFWLMIHPGRAMPPVPRVLIVHVGPALLGAAVVAFATASSRVQQLYGTPLRHEHWRAAGHLGTMRDSIRVKIDASLLTLFATGLLLSTFGHLLFSPLISRGTLGWQRWRVWLTLFSLASAAAGWALLRLRGLYDYGLKQNAIFTFLQSYRSPPPPMDVAALASHTPTAILDHDRELVAAASVAIDCPPSVPGVRLLRAPVADCNVLLIIMESTAAQYCDAATTPNLSALADTGLAMDHHFTTVSETSKALYALLYSDYLVDLGAQPRHVYGGHVPVAAAAARLRDNGFATAFVHSGYLRFGDKPFFLDGFDFCAGAEELRRIGDVGWAWGVFEETGVAALTQWIRGCNGRRFFATYATTFPHHPYHSPAHDKPFPATTAADRYRNSLHYCDGCIGQLFATLREAGLWDDTLVVVVGDHGETVSATPPGHGIAVTMEELRVPLLFANARRIAPARRADLYTNHLDVMPSVFGALGLPAAPEWLGRNLFADRVPARAVPVVLEQSNQMGIIDHGLLYRRDLKSSAEELLRIDDDTLLPLADMDARASLIGAYRDRATTFQPWVRWRHYRRAAGPNGSAAA